MTSKRWNSILGNGWVALKALVRDVFQLFRLEKHESPLFFYGIICLLWRIADFIPGRAGVITRRWIAKHRLKKLGKSPYFHAHNIFQDGRQTEIGDGFYSGRYNFFASGPITIGANVLLGNFVILETSGHAFDDPATLIQNQAIIREPIIIEDDVWIADRVTVLSGVTIGRGSVVGAGSVVTRDILPYSVVAGNPARVIRKRGSNSENSLQTAY